jgi:hypothetical protein
MKKFSALILALAVAIPAAVVLAHPSLAQGSLQDQVVSHERMGLDALKTGDLTLFANLTADDAVFVDDHGPADKATVVQNTSQFRLTDYTMANIKFVAISPAAGLISYDMTENGTSHGREFSAHVFVSSVWAERAGKWVCLFSQETAARQPVPATHP